RATATSAEATRFSCVKGAWRTSRLGHNRMLTVIDNAASLGPACDAAAIVVPSVRLRFNSCRSGATLFTGATLRRTGS
ncbi:hypothetical protein ACC827_38125, partial [Rhizobium ruizarguesonis]